ncbi:MAG: hypothetical protein K0S46_465 [Moraxellaceae bacterium]|nr:hypothetical protein [Moraxellaceae bacterium]
MRMLTVLLTLWLVSGCSARIEDYRAMQPALDLREYFNGDLTAWGHFQDRSGMVVKRFTVKMKGTWQGNEGRLEEYFLYDDGSRQTRIWHLTKLPDGRYTGRADDVVGTARGQSAGPALQWNYTLALPVNGKVYHVSMNDWMYLHDPDTLINRTVMSKFGVRLGEVTLFFRKGAQP